jgi:hypothetical protein
VSLNRTPPTGYVRFLNRHIAGPETDVVLLQIFEHFRQLRVLEIES